MHPTTEEQLQAVRRLLDEVAADTGITESSRQRLADASRQLRRIERSGAARLPFLVDDNSASVALLDAIADRLPALAATARAAVTEPMLSEPVVHAVNKELRTLLGQAVHELPDDEAANRWRRDLRTHLLRRTSTDPALNRPESLR